MEQNREFRKKPTYYSHGVVKSVGKHSLDRGQSFHLMVPGKLDFHMKNIETTFVSHGVQKSTQSGQNTSKLKLGKHKQKIEGGEIQFIVTENNFLIGWQKYDIDKIE